MKTALLLVTLSLILQGSVHAADTRPIDDVKNTADKIISILNDPKLQGPEHRTERHQLIGQELDRRFDWTAISRGCLGHQWTKLSRPERSEFTDLFKQFLERTYLDRIEPYYNRLEKIDYQGQKIIDQYASVKTVLTTKEKVDHPVEYRLERSANGDWRVYDILIEGVSLVSNYRSQFNEIITRSSFQALVNDLKSKIASNQG
jgi:phospholipid transport system substrate-binding protein